MPGLQHCVGPLVGADSLYRKQDCYTERDDAEEATTLCWPTSSDYFPLLMVDDIEQKIVERTQWYFHWNFHADLSVMLLKLRKYEQSRV